MKYTVTIDYTNFEFDSSSTAMTFAEMAAAHIRPKEYQKADVTIEIKDGDCGDE